MRISDTKVIQLIEAEPAFLVLVNETTGEEMKLDAEEVSYLKEACEYFSPALGIPSNIVWRVATKTLTSGSRNGRDDGYPTTVYDSCVFDKKGAEAEAARLNELHDAKPDGLNWSYPVETAVVTRESWRQRQEIAMGLEQARRNQRAAQLEQQAAALREGRDR